MAIQFASPAAHHLYPSLSGTSGTSVDIKNIPVILEPPLLRLQCRAGHAANGDPRYEYIQSPGRRTSYNEFFTHFIAAGLWTACKESKLVIQRHFQTLTWLAPDFDEAKHALETVVPRHVDSASRPLALCSEKDLFIVPSGCIRTDCSWPLETPTSDSLPIRHHPTPNTVAMLHWLLLSHRIPTVLGSSLRALF